MTTFKPRPYQELIIEHILSHSRCMVWSGMGTGKTVSTLTALSTLLIMGDTPALIVAPLRVAQSTWPDEVAKWSHLSYMGVSVVTGTPKQRSEALMRDADIYCTNYENLPWLVEYFRAQRRWPFKVIVTDEATRLKGFRLHQGSKRAKALAQVAFLSPHFIELTGTPTANGLIDLWGQAWFVDKGAALGKTMMAYEQSYFYPVRTGNEAYMVRWDPKTGSDVRIREKLKPYTITINSEDWFDVTEPIFNDIWVDLPPSAKRQYKEMEDSFYLSLQGETIEAVNALSKMGKCLQIASGAVYSDSGETVELHDAKIDALRSVIEEAAGAPVLVAYQFVHEAKRILEAFPKAVRLDKNPETIRRWNRGEIPVLLAHPASCGHGLNLQDGGNILVFFALDSTTSSTRR